MQIENHFLVRKAVLADAATLAEFNRHLAWETERMKLSAETVTQGVENLLRNPERGFYLVAEENKELAGCLMITFEWSDWRNANFWWVQSAYVREMSRRKGIYRKLYEQACELARESGDVCGIRLYVEKENLVAQQTYARLGMSESCYKIFETKIGE
jgi:GNAT superfamily N-acetyltransferase